MLASIAWVSMLCYVIFCYLIIIYLLMKWYKFIILMVIKHSLHILKNTGAYSDSNTNPFSFKFHFNGIQFNHTVCFVRCSWVQFPQIRSLHLHTVTWPGDPYHQGHHYHVWLSSFHMYNTCTTHMNSTSVNNSDLYSVVQTQLLPSISTIKELLAVSSSVQWYSCPELCGFLRDRL